MIWISPNILKIATFVLLIVILYTFWWVIFNFNALLIQSTAVNLGYLITLNLFVYSSLNFCMNNVTLVISKWNHVLWYYHVHWASCMLCSYMTQTWFVIGLTFQFYQPLFDQLLFVVIMATAWLFILFTCCLYSTFTLSWSIITDYNDRQLLYITCIASFSFIISSREVGCICLFSTCPNHVSLYWLTFLNILTNSNNKFVCCRFFLNY